MAEATLLARDSGARILRRLGWLLAGIAYYPLILAAYVVLQAYADNLGEVPAEDVLVSLAVVLVATAIGFVLVSLMYRDARRAAVPVAFTTVIILGYGYIKEALAPYGSGDDILLLLGASVAIVLIGLAARRATSLAPITQALNVASLLLLAVALVPIVTFASDVVRAPSVIAADILRPLSTDARIAPGSESPPRDIYYVVLDRYGSERALATRLGINNAEFTGWLREQGFQVLDDARANYVRSLPSIGAVLSMSSLDGLATEIGPRSGDYGPIVQLVRRSRVAAILQSLGYEYIHIGSWFPGTRRSDIADRGFASAAPSTFPSAILAYSAAGVVADALGISETPEKVHAAAAEYQFEVLRSLRDEPGPKLVIAHVLLPHAPFVFTEDGTFDPGPATYESQLAYTNREVRAFVEPLLRLPEEDRPIIILQADEGPYPERYSADINGFDWATATEDEVLSKFGILTAMYLPGPEGRPPLPGGLSSVNTFREVLTRYFAADLPNLPDRSFGAPESRPYDLTEVTDLFPSQE